ncbi:hypothetical protein KCP69_22970 [Salmonella enterica subsp. enterica]|nr:hypothetical protein KCP69_22970 [Salmonella enterica subsp. enterica]
MASIINTTIPRWARKLGQWQQQLLSDTRQRDALPPRHDSRHRRWRKAEHCIPGGLASLRHRYRRASGQILPKQKRQAQLR